MVQNRSQRQQTGQDPDFPGNLGQFGELGLFMRLFWILGLALFTLGLFLLPVPFASVAGALPLVVGLFWLGWFGLVRRQGLDLSRFLAVWGIAAIGFFALFALTAQSVEDLIYGFNTFAFILTLGVFWQMRALAGRRLLRFWVGAAVLGLLVGASWAIYQHDFRGAARVTAYVAGGSNLVARIAVLLAAFSMIVMTVDLHKGVKALVYFFGLGAGTLIVFYSGSRGGLLTLPLLVVLPLVFALLRKWLTSLLAWAGVLVFGLGTTGIVCWLDPNGLVTSTLNRLQSAATGEGMDASTLVRYQMWQVAFRSFLEHPIIGTGWHSFVEVARGTVLEDYLLQDPYFSFHSDIANFAVAGGIVGLILYFLLLLAPLLFWDTPRDHPYFRVRLYWAVSMPIIYIVLGLTDMVMGFDYPTMFYAFSFAIIWGATEQRPAKSEELSENTSSSAPRA